MTSPNYRDQEDIRRSCGGLAFAFVILAAVATALAIVAVTLGFALQFFFASPEIPHPFPMVEGVGRLLLPTQ